MCNKICKLSAANRNEEFKNFLVLVSLKEIHQSMQSMILYKQQFRQRCSILVQNKHTLNVGK